MDAQSTQDVLAAVFAVLGGGGFDQAGALRDTPGLNSINEAMNEEAVNEVGRRRLAHAGDVGPGGSTVDVSYLCIAYLSAFRGKRAKAKPPESVADIPSPVSAMTHM